MLLAEIGFVKNPWMNVAKAPSILLSILVNRCGKIGYPWIIINCVNTSAADLTRTGHG